jgi:hypothetical protein
MNRKDFLMHHCTEDVEWFGAKDDPDRKCGWMGRCDCGWMGEWHFESTPVACALVRKDYQAHVEAELGAQAYYDAPVGCRNCGSQHDQPVLVGLHVTSQACHRCGTVTTYYRKDSMRELIRDIANVMAELSLVAEGKTQAFDKPQITQGEGETGNRPPGPSSTEYDRRLAALVQWLEESQAVLTRARKTPAKVDWRKYIIETYEGEGYAAVAVEEGVHPTYIRKIRVEARRNPNDGTRKLEAA